VNAPRGSDLRSLRNPHLPAEHLGELRAPVRAARAHSLLGAGGVRTDPGLGEPVECESDEPLSRLELLAVDAGELRECLRGEVELRRAGTGDGPPGAQA
jgi:hypothetical protein